MAATAVNDKFVACYRFVSDLECHCRHIDCSITHTVSYEIFVIFVSYTNSSVELIEKEITDIKNVYVDKVGLYSWKIYWPMVKNIRGFLIFATMKILFKLPLQLNKKILKIVIDEFDVCHKFVSNFDRYIFNKYNDCSITHNA